MKKILFTAVASAIILWWAWAEYKQFSEQLRAFPTDLIERKLAENNIRMNEMQPGDRILLRGNARNGERDSEASMTVDYDNGRMTATEVMRNGKVDWGAIPTPTPTRNLGEPDRAARTRGRAATMPQGRQERGLGGTSAPLATNPRPGPSAGQKNAPTCAGA